MTTKQMKSTKVQTLKTISMTSGIFIGCLLGMFPLLWPEEYRLWGPKDEDITRTNSNDNVDIDGSGGST